MPLADAITESVAPVDCVLPFDRKASILQFKFQPWLGKTPQGQQAYIGQ